MTETAMGPDGRVWWKEDGDCYWLCRRDGSVIISLDDLLPSGETKAEARVKRFFADVHTKQHPDQKGGLQALIAKETK